MFIHIWDKVTAKADYLFYLARLQFIHTCIYLAENLIKSKSIAEWAFRRLERFGEEA
jgi:hypothetical protein